MKIDEKDKANADNADHDTMQWMMIIKEDDN